MRHTLGKGLGPPNAAAVVVVVLIGIIIAGRSHSQTGSAPKFNTASGGVQQADIEAAVKAICPGADITRSKDGRASGCRTCPKGTDFHGMNGPGWEMYAETPGHFTLSHDDNLILDGTGCDSHANNFGGSFMFMIKSDQVTLLTYDKGLITDECHKFAFPDGRDFLVCQGGWGGQGENDGTVFMASFGTDGKAATSQLIAVRDTTAMCGDDPGQVERESSVTDIVFLPRQTRQISGMTITATLGNVMCSQLKAAAKSGKQPASVKTYKFEFMFDGKRFKVAPGSKAALDRFRSD